MNDHPITRFRDERGLSRIDLAAKLHVSMETVWRWEAGKMKPSFAHLQELAKLGVPIEAVLQHSLPQAAE